MSQRVRSVPGSPPGETGAPTLDFLGAGSDPQLDAQPTGAQSTGAQSTGAQPIGAQPTDGQLIDHQLIDRQLIDRLFGRDDITQVRHEVSGRLAAAGLAGDRLQGFVLAINEVVTNAVLHAGGRGRITLGLTGGSAWCEVTDSGPGIPARYLSSPHAPGTFEVGGRGIWLAHQLCDEVTVATGPVGTTIGLRIGLSSHPVA